MDAAERRVARDRPCATRVRGGSQASVDDASSISGGSTCSRPSRDDALDIVFTALGATNANATALDDVLAARARNDATPDLAVCFRRSVRGIRPASRDGDHVRALGLATARVATAHRAAGVCTQPTADCACHGADGGRRDHAGARHRSRRRLARCARRRNGRARHGPRRAAWDAAVAVGRRAVVASDRGREPCDARPRVRRMRSSACSSGVRSRGSRLCAIASPTRSSRSRRWKRRSARRSDEPGPDDRRARRRRSPAAPPEPSPLTASRCSRASGSPPITRSTGTSSARSCSTGSSARPTTSCCTSDASCSRLARSRR